MTEHRKHAWTTLQLLICGSLTVSPFWFLAADLSDLSEAKATALGIAAAAVAKGMFELFKFLKGNGK